MFNLSNPSPKRGLSPLLIAQADHYIYFRNTRCDDNKPGDCAAEYQDKFGANAQAQMDYDKKVNAFITAMTLANKSDADAKAFIDRQVADQFLWLQPDGSYKYYPYGKPPGAP